MATIKLHIYSNEDPGTSSCDYRGQGELKGNHKTLAEKEFGASVETNDAIEKVIEFGPKVNEVLADLNFAGLGLRLGVFDQ